MSEREVWTIAMGDSFCFDIEPVVRRDWMSDASLNGEFPTRLSAIERVIVTMEETRTSLSASIARAKRMRTRASKATHP